MSTQLKKNVALICVVFFVSMLFSGFTAFAGAAGTGTDEELREIPLYIHGILVGKGVKIDETTYVPLRTFCETLDRAIEVSWDQTTQTVTIAAEGLIATAKLGEQYMVANGRYLYIPGGVIEVDGALMLPIREIAKCFGAVISWHDEDWSVSIDAEKIVPLADAAEFYDEEDLYWLSRIINAESGNQLLDGKIGVGNVVLNRVDDETCPDTIYDVIFDDRYGVQFTPTVTGTINDIPNEGSVMAAKMCFEGYSTVGDSLYFVNPEVGLSAWFYENFTYVATLGDHVFYA